jgi:acyl carrier protein|tara:strand:- start:271 stop:492 length:222 start_codon:yes stop_codon:yes gene_type:complete
MDKNQFLKNFINQFEEDNLDIDFQTNFRDLNSWDSMTSLMVISMLDEVYDTIISHDDFENFKTVEDIYNYLNK